MAHNIPNNCFITGLVWPWRLLYGTWMNSPWHTLSYDIKNIQHYIKKIKDHLRFLKNSVNIKNDIGYYIGRRKLQNSVFFHLFLMHSIYKKNAGWELCEYSLYI